MDDDALTDLLGSFPTRPRLLGLGEPVHGVEALPALRNRMFRHLVEHEGYRSIALESASLRAMSVDAFVAGGAGDLDEVMTEGFSHGFGASPANRDLVSWMRESNRDRPPAHRLRFFGFDAPVEMMFADSPRLALLSVHSYLRDQVDPELLPCSLDTIDRLVGDDERWSNPAAAMDPAQSVGSSVDAKELRLIADDLLALLRSRISPLVNATSWDEWWDADRCGRAAAGLLAYHAEMATASANRIERLSGVRDGQMADNLLAIVAQEEGRGPTFVFAHNEHLRKGRSHWQWGDQNIRWWPAGAIVHTRLSERYRFIASAVGSAVGHDIPVPPADTIEGLLYARSPGDVLLPAAAIGGDGLLPRGDIAPSRGYFPLKSDLVGECDAVAFVRDAT